MAKSKFKTGGGPKRTATIQFERGHALHGIEVEVELRVPIGVILGASSGEFATALKPFVKRIVRWNLTDDDGADVPVSLEAFGENFDVTETAALLAAWVEVVTQPSTPLGASSSDTTG